MKPIVFAAAITASVVVNAQDLAAKFGARESFTGVALSPDGTRISYLTPMPRGGGALVVANVAGGPSKIILSNPDASFKINWCRWAKADRVVCRIVAESAQTGLLLGVSRTVSVDPEGGGKTIILGQIPNSRSLGFTQNSGAIIDWLPDDPDNILMQIALQPELSTGTRLAKTTEGLAVMKVNVRTGSQGVYQPGRNGTVFWGTDGRGAVRIRGDVRSNNNRGYLDTSMSLSYLPKNSSNWQPLGNTDLSSSAGIEVEGFDESGDGLMILKPKDGRQALYRISADSSNREELIYAHPEVDVQGVRRIGKYRRPVGAAYETEYGHIEFFDAVLRKRLASIGRALPGQPTVSILDESWDGQKQLFFAGSDIDPGRYYLYDTKTKELNELSSTRPNLDTMAMGSMTPISYPATDGTMIPAYLTLPPGRTMETARNLPAILMPHGGPQARDTWGFDWVSQYFAQLGYVVLQPNYRGSSGYGEKWYQQNGFKSWRTAIGDINDGARWLAAKKISAADRLAIVGWSYGGYAALQGAVLDPQLYRAVVAIAPVTDLDLLKQNSREFSNYLIVSKFVGEGAHIAEGSPAKNATAIRAPVMMFHGTKDLNVDLSQSRTMDNALKSAGKAPQLIVYDGLEHSLLDSATRTDMLLRAGAFLNSNMKTQP